MSKKAISLVTLLFFLVFSFFSSIPICAEVNNEDKKEELTLQGDATESLQPVLIGQNEYAADRFIIKYKDEKKNGQYY